MIIYAGVDYEAILREAEKEADIILWDGGNNDVSFYKTDLHIVVADPHRVGHETSYHPGEANIRMADVVVINKVDTAEKSNVDTLIKNIKKVNPNAEIILANSTPKVEDPEKIKGKKVLVVEDGPTLTHGGMPYGAGVMAVKNLGAELVDPRAYAVGSIKQVFEKFTHLGKLLPAMGYGAQQIKELEETINKVECDVVLIGTPIDLAKHIKINKPSVRVVYDLEELDKPVTDFVEKLLNK